MTGAALVPAIWWLVAPSSAVAAALLLTLWSSWWLVRFSDDPAPFNGIVAGCSLGALVLVHRYGFIGALAAGTLLSNRRQSLSRGWPWLATAGLGWWLAWRLA